MTQADVDAEIARSREFLHAMIDLRCELHRKHNPYRAITKAHPLPVPERHPQLHYLWRSRGEYEREKGAYFQEAIRVHPDRTWTWQPTAGVGHVYSDVVIFRTYRTVFGCRHSVTPWQLQMPIGMIDVSHS